MENKISLFDTNIPPLAERVRPKSLQEFIGQSHILGENKILNLLVGNMRLFSMILWGPPGSGKTTLARILTLNSNYELHQISAVSSGVKDLRRIIDKSLINRSMGKETVLFIDEIHRFNKSQQDALLHAVENGTVILIGATTENPSFEVISPLLSRSKVLTLNPLSLKDLSKILSNAFKEDIILFPHRLAPEKQPDIFKDLAKELPEYKFIICMDQNLTKDAYHKLLAKSKMVFSANLQETLGISPYEGVLVGAIPLVPDRLSYIEMYDDEWKYPNLWTIDWDHYQLNKKELVDRIKSDMQNYNMKALKLTNLCQELTENYFSANCLLKTLELYDPD